MCFTRKAKSYCETKAVQRDAAAVALAPPSNPVEEKSNFPYIMSVSTHDLFTTD